MRAKAIKDLNQFSDSELFVQVSEGLDHIFEHIRSIEADVKFLADQNKKCGFNILESILQEESAKFLILLDAIRCPRVPADNFTKQLAGFNDHLAKGIYSLVYDYRPTDFREIRIAVQQECNEYYLDGPNEVDWIFKNEVKQTREEQIYVDFVENEGKHYWLTPKRYYPLGTIFYLMPSVYEVASALWFTGCTKPDALSSIAETWRLVELNDDFHWDQLRNLNSKTLDELDKLKLLKSKEKEYVSTIIDKWMFPLYGLNIGIVKVNKNELKESKDRQLSCMYFDGPS